ALRSGTVNARRAAIIVLDGLGCGAAPDAGAYGDDGSDTLGNVLRASPGLRLPNLTAMGLGHCVTGGGMEPAASPTAAHGVAVPQGRGKDSTTGHWELCGLVLETPFPTFPDGFPSEVVAEFARRTGREVLGNYATSGTAVLDRLG